MGNIGIGDGLILAANDFPVELCLRDGQEKLGSCNCTDVEFVFNICLCEGKLWKGSLGGVTFFTDVAVLLK